MLLMTLIGKLWPLILFFSLPVARVIRHYKDLSILLDALALGDLPTVVVGAGPVALSNFSYWAAICLLQDPIV